MITIFGKTVYKVLLEFKGGRRLVSPIYSFEYELGKVYKKKPHEPGYYSWLTESLAQADIRYMGIKASVSVGIYECKIPWFCKYKEKDGMIISEKIKIKRRI
jgi:hypothetical protein